MYQDRWGGRSCSAMVSGQGVPTLPIIRCREVQVRSLGTKLERGGQPQNIRRTEYWYVL